MAGLEEFVEVLSKAEGDTSGCFHIQTPKRRLPRANLLCLYIGRLSVSKNIRAIIGASYCGNILSCLLTCKHFIISLGCRSYSRMKSGSPSVFMLSGPFGAYYHMCTFPCSVCAPSGARARPMVNHRQVAHRPALVSPLCGSLLSA